MRILLAAVAALPLLAFAATAAQAMDPAKSMDTAAGTVLTDAKGMTLYTFDKDSAGMSACYDQCAKAWPPMVAPATVSGDWSVVDRKDGIMQLAYKGQPLYLWVKDSKPGDVTGDGFKDVWHVAKP